MPQWRRPRSQLAHRATYPCPWLGVGESRGLLKLQFLALVLLRNGVPPAPIAEAHPLIPEPWT
eukprot:11702559-Alexandrium_andersonii.AAC.1